MKEKTVLIFIKRNMLLSIIGFLAVAICFLYFITWDCEELFHNAGVIFSMIYTISISYVVSLIFYFIQVFLPNYKKQSAQIYFLKNSIEEILVLMNEPFKKLFNGAESNTYDLTNITEEVFKGIELNLDKPIGIYRNHKEITIYEYMGECVIKTDDIIKNITVQFIDIMTAEELSLLQRIYRSAYHFDTRDNISNPPGNTVPLKKNTNHSAYAGIILSPFKYEMVAEYANMYKELLKLTS